MKPAPALGYEWKRRSNPVRPTGYEEARTVGVWEAPPQESEQMVQQKASLMTRRRRDAPEGQEGPVEGVGSAWERPRQRLVAQP